MRKYLYTVALLATLIPVTGHSNSGGVSGSFSYAPKSVLTQDTATGEIKHKGGLSGPLNVAIIKSNDAGNTLTIGTDGGLLFTGGSGSTATLTQNSVTGVITYTDSNNNQTPVNIISADGGNVLSIGTDGGLLFSGGPNSISTLAQNTGTGVITHDDGNGNTTAVNIVSADGGNVLTIGTDGGLLFTGGGSGTTSTLTQNTGTGVITHNDGDGNSSTANVISSDAGNTLTVGSDGGVSFSGIAHPSATIGSTTPSVNIVNAGTSTNQALSFTIDSANTTDEGITRYATQAEVDAGTITDKILAPATVVNTTPFSVFGDAIATEMTQSDTGLTNGSVPFVDTDGTIREDNTGLFYNVIQTELGIGTTTPVAPLHVNTGNGQIVAEGTLPILYIKKTDKLLTDPTFNSQIRFTGQGGGVGALGGIAGFSSSADNTLQVSNRTTDGLAFFAGTLASAGISITGTGSTNANYIGMGIGAPAEKLHVVGNILATGTVTPSDIRYKKDIVAVTDNLAKVLAFEPISFEWDETKTVVTPEKVEDYDILDKDGKVVETRQRVIPATHFIKGDGQRKTSLSAQSVKAVAPELTKTYNFQGKEVIVLDKEAIIAALVGAVIELNAKIEGK